ncbi:MAG: hypothetical protein IJY85_07475 [Ruminococcus sp.]|nr:hypothetical protein [Ruminococcus sp.]
MELNQAKQPASETPKAKRSTERRIALLNVFILGVVFAAAALWTILGERPTMSETENRNLATFPEFSWESYFDGSFTAGIANFFDDTVPGRETFKHLTATIRQYMGLQTEDGATIHMNSGNQLPDQEEPEGNDAPVEETVPVIVTTTTTAATTATQTTTSDTTSETESASTTSKTTTNTTTASNTTTAVTTVNDGQEDDDGGELSNNILIYKNRGIMLYGGSFNAGRNYAAYVNAYKADLGPDVNVYSMVIPTSCSFYTPEKFQYLIGSEFDNINNINDHLVDVIPVDAYGVMEAHKDEAILARTDHHWTGLGAYYAAQEFAKTADVPFKNLTTYQKVVKPGYVGTLYGYSGDIKLKNNPEDFIYYIPNTTYTTTYYNIDMSNPRYGNLLLNLDNVKPVSWYLVYLGGDERVTQVDTECKNGRSLCIIKDSYGNALPSFLTASFEHIYVIDMRYFKQNAITFMKDRGVTDVLFAMNSFSATGSNYKKLETLRTQ